MDKESNTLALNLALIFGLLHLYTSEGGNTTNMDLEGLEKLKRPALMQLCKARGIKAVGKVSWKSVEYHSRSCSRRFWLTGARFLPTHRTST